MQRLKVPPSINQFAKALDKNAATELFKLLVAYQPESKSAKQERLKAAAGETDEYSTLCTAIPARTMGGSCHDASVSVRRYAMYVLQNCE
jgi:hypothetical protein